MNYEKFFDNEDDECEENVSEWLQNYLDSIYKSLMDEFNDYAELYLIGVDDDKQTIDYCWVLN